jgi:hypothetical protein
MPSRCPDHVSALHLLFRPHSETPIQIGNTVKGSDIVEYSETEELINFTQLKYTNLSIRFHSSSPGFSNVINCSIRPNDSLYLLIAAR